MKRILGLDLGAGSIGWCMIQQDVQAGKGEILGMGARIISAGPDTADNFGEANHTVTKAAERAAFRNARRSRERQLLRRERLHRVLNVLGFLPGHYAAKIDFEKDFGKFIGSAEPKLAYQPFFPGQSTKKNQTEYQFIFKQSFEEMLADFAAHQPELISSGKKIPYDWTLYYLRKKALTQKIEKEELAWLLLSFNRKRGYQRPGREGTEEIPDKTVEFHSLAIVDVKADQPKKNGKGVWYSLTLENGWVYRRASTVPLFDWKHQVKDFIVTTELSNHGAVAKGKDGSEKRSFRAPSENDWMLAKKKTEQDIEASGKSVGAYIYDELLKKPGQKIIGKLVRTIDRKFYKEELIAILTKQAALHPEMQSGDRYHDCIKELYKNNEAQQAALQNKGFMRLFVEDLIFYQRPLKSLRSSVNDCPLEHRKFEVKGCERKEYLPCAPSSHIFYQEFRLWKWIHNLRIYRREDDANVTSVFLRSTGDIEGLFGFLRLRKDITQEALLGFLVEKSGLRRKALRAEASRYRWNYADHKERKYPCCETMAQIKSRLAKVTGYPDGVESDSLEEQLWHIIYSVTDSVDYEKALVTFSKKHHLGTSSFVENFKNFPTFKSGYAPYSLKAIKKMLPLLRAGRYWSWEAIDERTRTRIDMVIDGELGPDIGMLGGGRAEDNAPTGRTQFQGLPERIAKHVVYGRGEENPSRHKWDSVDDIEKYLSEFRQHSLGDPTIERAITETLRIVKDLWSSYGHGKKDFFDEIHVGLGQEMKNNGKKGIERRKEQDTDLRINALLLLLSTDSKFQDVNPHSPQHHELLKVYESCVLGSRTEIPDEMNSISTIALPTAEELQLYAAWLGGIYCSPYTGSPIPLDVLFNGDYQICDIIPQDRSFDPGINNKVICESAICRLKGNRLGPEFIKDHGGETTELQMGGIAVRVFETSAYELFVNDRFGGTRTKRGRLLIGRVPIKPVRGDPAVSGHISKFVCSVLSNMVANPTGEEENYADNAVAISRKTIEALSQDWGLDQVWDELVLPRFERMNGITDSTVFTYYDEGRQKHLPVVPLELSKGFDKKKLDHRHCALAALVIACAPERDWPGHQANEGLTNDLHLPWDGFALDAKQQLQTVVPSFKQYLRVVGTSRNVYESYADEKGNIGTGPNGQPIKSFKRQTRGDVLSIRKTLHQGTFSGIIAMDGIKIPPGKILTATRKSLDERFSPERIMKVTDTGIQKILLNHLKANEGNPALAFSPEGIGEMNRNIFSLNGNKGHQPILKVRTYELGKRFMVGSEGAKKKKFVQSKEGSNLFYAVYLDKKGQRAFEVIPLHEVVAHQKWRRSLEKTERQHVAMVPLRPGSGKFLFYLSPNDLVYVPMDQELYHTDQIDFNRLSNAQMKRLFNVNDFSSTCYFRPSHLARAIAPKEVDMDFEVSKNKITGSYDTKTATFEGKQIKDVCIKLRVDRLGNISRGDPSNLSEI